MAGRRLVRPKYRTQSPCQRRRPVRKREIATNTPEPSPREMARAFTPQLTALVENPLFSDVWSDPALSPRDRSIATVAALIALYRPEQLPAHLLRARENGVTRDELAALITHIAF